MTRKAVLSGSGKGGEKRLGNETSLAAYFIALGLHKTNLVGRARWMPGLLVLFDAILSLRGV